MSLMLRGAICFVIGLWITVAKSETVYDGVGYEPSRKGSADQVVFRVKSQVWNFLGNTTEASSFVKGPDGSGQDRRR